MGYLFLVCALILAGVLFAASIAKLLDRDKTTKSLVAFGIPTEIAPIFSVILPTAELLTAILLVVSPTIWIGGLISTVMMLGFTGVVAVSLYYGKHPACACFGEFSADEISYKTVIRNLWLVILAISVLIGYWDGEGRTIGQLVQRIGSSENALGVLSLVSLIGVAINLWINAHLLVQYGGLSLAMLPQKNQEGLKTGERISEFLFQRNDDIPKRSADLFDKRPRVHLIFVDALCRYCNDVYEYLRSDLPEEKLRDVVIVGSGDREILLQKIGSELSNFMVYDVEDTAKKSLMVNGTPTLVTIDSNGTVVSEYSVGAAEIRNALS